MTSLGPRNNIRIYFLFLFDVPALVGGVHMFKVIILSVVLKTQEKYVHKEKLAIRYFLTKLE